MAYLPNRLFFLFISLAVFFFIGGCTFSPDALNLANLGDDLPLQENNDPLEEVESRERLQQELEALQQTGDWERGETLLEDNDRKEPPYDFPVVINKQVQMYLNLFQVKQRKHFQRWLTRSGRYLPMMKKELQKAGLPLDLVYLAMIESGFSQRAYSRARAVGLWQFIKGTGRLYHLKIGTYIDERRDAEKSTRAAVAFLSDLYNTFGDWYLAVAAYNAGPGKIRNGLKRYKTRNFWQLAKHRYLRLETKRYVPKLIAAIIIAKDPLKYGFDPVKLDPPMAYDTLEVGPGLSLKAVALISNGDVKEIKKLNQELRRGITPANLAHYPVKIPVGSRKLAARNLNRLHSVVSTGYKIHIIRRGETLSRICKRYRINQTTLLKVNKIKKRQLIAGKRLRIPYRTIRYQLLSTDRNGSIIALKDSLILHTVQPGETVSKIARRYNIPADMIVAWNGLASIHKVKAGQQLSLYIDQQHPRPAPSRPVQMAQASMKNTPVIFARRYKKIVKKSPTAAKTNWYTVKAGDSLWTISRKFKVSARQIKKWNRLTSNLIHPGVRLKL